MRLPLPLPAIVVQRRVVVTGLGAVSPLACGIEATWSRLLAGSSGVRKLQAEDPHYPLTGIEQLPTTLAATVPRVGAHQPSASAHLYNETKWSRHPRFIQYALEAAEEALRSSGWQPTSDADRNVTGVAIGSGIGSLEDVTDADRVTLARGPRRLSPQFVPRILLNLAAGHVGVHFGLRGPNHCAATACATGAHAIGDAFRLIKFGEADVMLAGGTEASVNVLSLGGFGRMRALCTKFNDTPEAASRPFDAARDGFVVGEGAAVLVLEELEHAKARGASLIAEVRGCGLSGDGHHITSPPEDGSGACRAMQAAIAQSGLQCSAVDYLNAHATSTPLGDAAEARAIDTVFGHRTSLLVSSTKGATGHLLGAAGALEAAFAVLAIRDGQVPLTLNLSQPNPAAAFTHVMQKSAAAAVEVAMSNSFGFGGTNASLMFSRL